ncbi:hypothetical protein K2173_013380 [Erythroxylum novogranatense]|uniref:RNA uridylyltransferase n=1 Tax=Erythroxylum novogranatense TaxID=1862640 RepID=A0AAV8SA77_9ROSI|nr:hypothetical protein K2173_013380 [Erythroxylum novogranatense]
MSAGSGGGGGGGGDEGQLLQPPNNGGEFLLSLLHRSNQQAQTPSPGPPQSQLLDGQQHRPQQQEENQQSLTFDPAVAAVGPSVAYPPPSSIWPAKGNDLLSPPWLHSLSPSNFPPGFLGFPQNPWLNQFQGKQTITVDEPQRLGFPSTEARASSAVHKLIHHKQQPDQKLVFGSFSSDIQSSEGLLNVNSKREVGLGGDNLNGLVRNQPFNPRVTDRKIDYRTKQHHGSNYKSSETRTPPPGFSSKPRGGGNWDVVNMRRELNHNVGKEKVSYGKLRNRNAVGNSYERLRSNNDSLKVRHPRQLDHPGPPAGTNLHPVSASDIEESLVNMHGETLEDRKDDDDRELDDLGEKFNSSLIEDESENRKEKKYKKESRSDNRGQQMLSQRMRMMKRQMECPRDIERLNGPFLAIYQSLIPLEEEKAKQKQLLTLLENIVSKEWPEAQLYLYGSCANSFGVSKSDIDVCLAIDDADINKSEFLLKLADILQSDNLQNVQALTRARVPIVKLMDPTTGISCDICINNVLAVVNTKLLRDYAEIDVRLRQLAFIVKHWAKSRGVNETYQGTLSSYAYVLMCIHFLQIRRPAILPSLQEMGCTYSVIIDDVKCSYFDQVEKLRGFGSRNKETIAQLVWAFFNYWAYRHDYASDVISVRTGSIISKREKDWTRRIGNDRHLICIEDPFEVSHDLGRVVDKHSIRVLREEFERAASIMQYDPNPCVTLFEPYVPA